MLSDFGASEIAELLEMNVTLQRIDISNNLIMDDMGFRSIAFALAKNRHLKDYQFESFDIFC
jgi:hypothetical protein